MKFDNNKALYKIMRTELISPLVFAALISISFLGIYSNKYLPLENYEFALLILAIFLVLSYFWYGAKKSYFSLDANGNSIIIKYFVITPKFFKTKPQMVKIPKSSFFKYNIESSFFGMKKSLFLFQKTPKGVVKYPPIYISALNSNELEMLKKALQK